MLDAPREWFDRLVESGVLLSIGTGLAVAIAITIVVVVLWGIRQATLRGELRETYGIANVPKTVRMRVVQDDGDPGRVELAFPSWTYENRDGAADRRRADNPLIRGVSTLTIGRLEARDRNPLLVYALARQARRGGATIALTREERWKHEILVEESSTRSAARSIDDIIARFAERPTDFENFCAEIYRAKGFDVTVTSPTRDGGFDLTLRRGHERWLVECKCFARENPIGRPHLQKLVGANAVERAEYLVFVTTSSFTPAAVGFARQTDMVLIDGAALVQLCREAGFGGSTQQQLEVADIELTRHELLQFYPVDLRD